MSRFSAVSCLVLVPLLLGCGLTNAQTSGLGDVRFELAKDTFRKGEPIEARFVNDSDETVYIVSFGTCASVLQKLGDEGWGDLYPPDMACAAVITYHPFEAGREQSITFTPEQVEHLAGDPVGTYRLSWHVAPSKHYEEAQPVSSHAFEIVE